VYFRVGRQAEDITIEPLHSPPPFTEKRTCQSSITTQSYAFFHKTKTGAQRNVTSDQNNECKVLLKATWPEIYQQKSSKLPTVFHLISNMCMTGTIGWARGKRRKQQGILNRRKDCELRHPGAWLWTWQPGCRASWGAVHLAAWAQGTGWRVARVSNGQLLPSQHLGGRESLFLLLFAQ
jgi:hypothetical protein